MAIPLTPPATTQRGLAATKQVFSNRLEFRNRKQRPPGSRKKGLGQIPLQGGRHETISGQADKIIGVLSGFDRLVFRGTLRAIAYAEGLSQAANERYLEALASADTSVPLVKLVENICRPTVWKDKRVRALRPWDQDDTRLFATVSRGGFAVNGFRNRDLQEPKK